MNLDEMTIDIQQNIEVNAGLDEAFKALLYRFGEGNTGPDGTSLQLKLEPFAGGRWFRDRGQGVQHLWGHVQVIKAPVLLELSGPLFMSYPAINHLELKLEEIPNGTKISLRHRAVGMIEQAHREGVKDGWRSMLESVKADLSKASGVPV